MTTQAVEPPSARVGALRDIAEPPRPSGWSVVGCLLQSDRPRPHQAAERWCAQYGSLVKMKLGPMPFRGVGDSEAIIAIFCDRPILPNAYPCLSKPAPVVAQSASWHCWK